MVVNSNVLMDESNHVLFVQKAVGSFGCTDVTGGGSLSFEYRHTGTVMGERSCIEVSTKIRTCLVALCEEAYSCDNKCISRYDHIGILLICKD